MKYWSTDNCCLTRVDHPLSPIKHQFSKLICKSCLCVYRQTYFCQSVSIAPFTDVFIGLITCTSSNSLLSPLQFSSSLLSSLILISSIISSSSSSSIFNGLFEQNSGARSSFWALKLLISYVSALQGSSSSVTAALCWSFDMLAFEKQFMTVSWMYVTFPS